MAIGQTNPYITRRELSTTLSNYIEKSYILEYVNQEIEDSLDNINVYTKTEVDNLLKKYITTIEVDTLLDHNDSYFSKQETRNLINATINAFKNVELPNKLNDYVSKNELNNSINSLYYTKQEINNILQKYVTTEDDSTTSIETYINNALSHYVKQEELNESIYNIVNANSRKFEYSLNSKLSTFALKETLNEQIKKLSDSVSILDSKVDQYYSKDEVDKKIQMYIRNWCYTREDTRSLIQVSIDFFKNNYLESRLDNFVTKETYYDHIENYYDKDEIDEKLEGENFCNIKYVTYSEYKSLKRRYQIYDNYIYVVSNFGRIMYIYIGSMLLAKRDTEGSFGFPYTFPITF